MQLELESGKIIENVGEEDLPGTEGEEFAILSVEPGTYLQWAQQPESPWEYILEYQEQTTDRHFAARDPSIPFERVLSAMRKYLRGDESWKDDFAWERIELS